MKRLLNFVYRTLTTVKIYATDEDVLWDSWDADYKPFGYVVKKYPTRKNGWFVMTVCKQLIK